MIECIFTSRPPCPHRPAGVNLALRTAVRMAVSKVLLYPKALHMDLTANGGLVPGPVGLLQARGAQCQHGGAMKRCFILRVSSRSIDWI